MTALARRDLLGSVAAAALSGLIGAKGISVTEMPSAVPHPDAELLGVCAALGRLRDEWQRLWTFTSDGPDLATEADRAWERYDSEVWPGRTGGLLARLLTLPARTPEGLAAKAAAVCAQDDATSYSGDCHDDACALWASVARDAAGALYQPLGEAGEARRA